MHETSRTFLPAAGHDWFLPLYDPMVRVLGGLGALKMLLGQAGLQNGQRVLDIGCGTGTLSTMIKTRHPDIEVVGLDPDPHGLGRARQKAARAGLAIRFDEGFADRLPYPDASFDRVFSSFMFHHLPADTRANTLISVRRVLKPGGSLHLLDFEGPAEDGGVVSLMRQAGLEDPKKTGRKRLLFWHVEYYRANA